MNIIKKSKLSCLLSLCASCIVGTLITTPKANADSIQTTLQAQIILDSSCAIDSTKLAGGENVGNFDFGENSTLFTDATTEAKTNSGSSFNIICESTTTPTMKLIGGTNDGNSGSNDNHAMAFNGRYVPYSIYNSNNLSSPISPNTVFYTSQNSGQEEEVPLTAIAHGNTGLIPGTYTDTLTIEINF